MSEWQPIETAPRNGEVILGYMNGQVYFFRWQDKKDGREGGWRDHFIYIYRDHNGPTHWMPLPKPPM